MTASAWRAVRVFISSTFRDVQRERGRLQKEVFTALRAKTGEPAATSRLRTSEGRA